MIEDKCAVVRTAGPVDLSGISQEEIGRKLLDEFLLNPFLDDDLQGLALRAGSDRRAAAQAVEGLCRKGWLKEAGRRGYSLDPERIGALDRPSAPPDTGEDELPAEALVALRPEEAARKEKPPSGSAGEEPPLGLILLDAEGRAELVDESAAAWLGIPAESLDAVSFEAVTGVAPGAALEKTSLVSFCLRSPRCLFISLRAFRMSGGRGAIILLQDAALQADLVRVNARIQEEMFARLRLGMAEPMQVIRSFLDDPAPGILGPARAALEQVDAFLEEFLLNGGAVGAPADPS